MVKADVREGGLSTVIITRIFLVGALSFWALAVIFMLARKTLLRKWALFAGWLCIAAILLWLWVSLGRPPLRTMGETRLWYAFFLPLAAMFAEARFRAPALCLPVLIMASCFVAIDLVKPELFDKALMPALRSPWFIPHVLAYMTAYAALALASFCAARMLFRAGKGKSDSAQSDYELSVNCLRLGFPLLTCGIIFGAFWAKEAWGDYWSWDVKETWALVTWLAYGISFHIGLHRSRRRAVMVCLVVAFALMVFCWFGMKLLPSAASSIHVYS